VNAEGILQPVFRRDAAVPDRLGHGRGGRCGRAVDRRHRDLVDRAVPERGGLVHILILQFGHPRLGQLQAAQRLEEAADRGAEGLEAMRVRLGQSVLCRVRKSRLGGLVLRASRWRRARCALAAVFVAELRAIVHVSFATPSRPWNRRHPEW
jgi:hypothetical protein